MQAGKLYAATESFLPFEIELSRDSLRPVGFTTIGGMLEQEVHKSWDGGLMISARWDQRRELFQLNFS